MAAVWDYESIMRIDIETIERATVDGVVPAAVEELPGWLLAFDPGTVGRATSAVPLHHNWHDSGIIPEIIARYEAKRMRAQFRLADSSMLGRLHAALGRLDFEPKRPSYVQVIEALPLSEHTPALGAETLVAETADDAWKAAFCAVSFGAKDQFARAEALARSPNTVYISVREREATSAVGAITFARGVGCIHGMRTLPERRGQGLAQRVLGACARAALGRRVEQLFLQVETDNQAARAAYKRAGFTTFWRYSYWQPLQ
jgi:ribosomal protein S18 acetylase RimI-like enzyme